MAISKRGMTIDLGYPLSKEEMEDLFIDLFPELKDRCVDWLKDENIVRPLMIAGQIGTGKTSLLKGNNGTLVLKQLYNRHGANVFLTDSVAFSLR